MADGDNPIFVQLAAFAGRVYPTLGQRSYYQLLNVQPGADVDAIRAAFYKLAQQLHPDRYHVLPDEQARQKLEAIYARITEAYRILTSPEKRGAYDKGLAQGKLRWDSADREKKGPKSAEDTITHPEAKKFFRFAKLCGDKGDWKGAVMNLNFARAYEPGAAILKEKLAEVQALLKGGAAK